MACYRGVVVFEKINEYALGKLRCIPLQIELPGRYSVDLFVPFRGLGGVQFHRPFPNREAR